MLDKTELAKEINDAIGATDAEGNSIEVTAEMETYAEAIITTLTSATFTHLLVEGTTANGAPLQAGKAENGLFLPPLLAPTWLGVMQTGFPTANPAELLKEATCSTTYLSGASRINFKPGNITGQCTSTPSSPGPLAAGQGSQGTLDELDGSDWNSSCLPPDGDPTLGQKILTAITDYINKNSEASYLPNTVNGVCPPGSGPLTAGIGSGGTIK